MATKTSTLAALLAAGSALMASPAFADPPVVTETYDQALPSPGGSTPGFYTGTHSAPNGGFTVDTNGDLTIGLRAKERLSGSIIDSPTNSYTVNTGSNAQVGGGLSGGSPSLGDWNYEFSFYVTPSIGGPAVDLSDLTGGLITITDSTSGLSTSFNPLVLDNEMVDASGNLIANVPSNDPAALAGEQGAQNSENLAYPTVGLNGYDFNAVDTYTITATATLDGNTVSDQIVVNAVPEPASMALLGAGLFGLAAVRRKRRA